MDLQKKLSRRIRKDLTRMTVILENHMLSKFRPRAVTMLTDDAYSSRKRKISEPFDFRKLPDFIDIKAAGGRSSRSLDSLDMQEFDEVEIDQIGSRRRSRSLPQIEIAKQKTLEPFNFKRLSDLNENKLAGCQRSRSLDILDKLDYSDIVDTDSVGESRKADALLQVENLEWELSKPIKLRRFLDVNGIDLEGCKRSKSFDCLSTQEFSGVVDIDLMVRWRKARSDPELDSLKCKDLCKLW